MNPRMLLWTAAPLALSLGVIWLSAQEPGKKPQAFNVAELAEKLQTREKALNQKEAELRELEQRLQTLHTTLDGQRQEMLAKEKELLALKDQMESLRLRKPIDPQLIRTYEAMDPVPGAQALKELAGVSQDMAVALLGGMQAKKAAKLMNQLTTLDAKLAGKLSERVGATKEREKASGA